MSEWLDSLPLYWAKVVATVFFLSVMIWALTRPREYIFKDAPDRNARRDLRLWAVLILLIQIVIYLSF